MLFLFLNVRSLQLSLHMKRILLFLPFLLLASSFPALAQNPKLSADQSMILDLEVKWMTAVAKKDSATLQQLLGKNFELSKIGGLASTNIKRDKWIQNYMKMHWSKFEFRNMQISVDSNLATVNTILSFKLKPYPFRLSSGVLDVWRKTDGVWKVERRFLSQDNLSRWLLILEGIAIGMILLVLIRWIRTWFRPKEEVVDR
jgi:hypothetical protein